MFKAASSLCCGSSICKGSPKWLQHWASPRRLLLLLCTLNLLFFLDRGVVASNGVNGSAEDDDGSTPGISSTFNLTLFQDGLVAALYYVGVMLGAPVFAQLSKRYNVLRLLGFGGALFALAALLCGFSHSFAMVLVFRCLVGGGTGSLIALGPPLLDDHAPPASRALWLGLFYLCMPTGVALGYLFGGAVGSGLTWRAAFWIEAGLAVPLTLWCLWAPPVDICRPGLGGAKPVAAPSQLAEGSRDSSELPECGSMARSNDGEVMKAAGGAGQGDPPPAEPDQQSEQQQQQQEQEQHQQQGRGEATGEQRSSARKQNRALTALSSAAGAFLLDLRQLARRPLAVCVILGLACWNGFIGAYGYYGPKAVRDLFSVDPEDADFVFGAVLAAAGLVGSLAGGLMLDVLGSTMPAGMQLGAAGLAAGCVLAVVAVTAAHSQAAFWPLLALAEVAVFMVQAPANAICMWCVPPGLRTFALSISEVMQHLLGDIPMPPALGAVQGAIDNWRLSLALFALLLAVGAGVFLVGIILARRARDYRIEEKTLPREHLEGGMEPPEQEHELLLLRPAAAVAGEGEQQRSSQVLAGAEEGGSSSNVEHIDIEGQHQPRDSL